MRFHRCSRRSYNVSPITLRQLPLRSPIKTMIIWWLTKQIKNSEKVGTFLESYPWWSPVLIKSQGNIAEDTDIFIFLEHYHFFQKTQFVEHKEVGVC